MLNMLKGYSPDGQTALCQNPGEDHHPGWDLTFSPPKSVSIAWSNASDELRIEIESAHREAVAGALRFINDEATCVRVGKGGTGIQQASLVAALFQHSSNRAEEPQLHTHAIVFNVAKTKTDGKWRTLHPYPIYRAYMAAGALYKAEMADRMRTLGFQTHRTKDSFELSQVPATVCDAQSSRSKAIEAALERQGQTRSSASAVTKELFALDTRAEKGTERVVRDFERWQKENAGFGFGPNEQAAILNQQGQNLQQTPFNGRDHSEVISEGLQKLTARSSTFNDFDLYRAAAEAAITEVGGDKALAMAREAKDGGEVVALGPNRFNENRYSTQEMAKIEQENMLIVAERRNEDQHPVSPNTVTRVLEDRPTIKSEQADALRHVVNGKDGVSFIEGDAGTGKSFLMAAVRDAYESNGYEVRGISFTNKAAKNLEEGSGIKDCQSVDSLLIEQRKGLNPLHCKSVLVLDEAGMLDSRKMRELMRLCKDSRTKLLCIGDQKQIQPIAAGQSFGSMKREFGSKRLTEIMRQKDEWLKTAINDFAEGRVRQGIDELDRRDALKISNTRLEARQAIISEWKNQVDASGVAKAPLMVVTTNAEVDQLNLLARDQLIKNGALEQGMVLDTDHGQRCFAVGDRIVFTSNFKKKGIYNAGVATIEKIKKPLNPSASKTITVKTENGRRVKFDPSTFKSFRHAYAITTHKSQGSTVDRVLVLVDGSLMDREKFYVAVSRGREKPAVFVDQQTLGELPAENRQRLAALPIEDRSKEERELFKLSLGRILGASHEKDTSQDYSISKSQLREVIKANPEREMTGWDGFKSRVFEQLRNIHIRLSTAFGERSPDGKSGPDTNISADKAAKDMSYDR